MTEVFLNNLYDSVTINIGIENIDFHVKESAKMQAPNNFN